MALGFGQTGGFGNQQQPQQGFQQMRQPGQFDQSMQRMRGIQQQMQQRPQQGLHQLGVSQSPMASGLNAFPAGAPNRPQLGLQQQTSTQEQAINPWAAR